MTSQVSEAADDLAMIVAPERSVVLVVDMQNDFCSPLGAVARSGVDISMMEALVPPICDLLTQARSRAVPIVFIQGTQTPGGESVSPAYRALLRRTMLRNSEPGAMFGIEGTWGAETLAAFSRRPNEPIIVKRRSSSFVGTDLDQLLRPHGTRTVLVVGEQSCGCVEATFRHAADLDYYPVAVRDCMASFDRDLHEAAIMTMSRRWWAPTSAEVFHAWEMSDTPQSAITPR